MIFIRQQYLPAVFLFLQKLQLRAHQMEHVFPVDAGVKIPSGNHKKILRVSVFHPLFPVTGRHILLRDPPKQIVQPHIVILFVQGFMQDCHRLPRFQNGILHIIVIHVFRRLKQTVRQGQVPDQRVPYRNTVTHIRRFVFRRQRRQVQVVLYRFLFRFGYFPAVPVYGSPHGPRVCDPGEKFFYGNRRRQPFHIGHIQTRRADFLIK